MNRTRAVASVGLLSILVAAVAFAHDLGVTEAQLTLGERRFELVLLCDLDALALGAGPAADDAELARTIEAMPAVERQELIDDLATMFRRRVRLLHAEGRIDFEVEFPDREAGITLDMTPPTFLGLTARLTGPLPGDVEALQVRLSRAFPPAQLTVLDGAGNILLEEHVPRGEDSSVIATRGQTPAGGAPSDEAVEPSSMTPWIVALAAAAALAGAVLAWRRGRREPPAA